MSYSNKDIVLKVDNVSKNFVLPHERAETVKNVFTRAFKKRNRSSETYHALKDISFDVKKGEFFGIVGRNGSGKSTMLKILAGIYIPNKGQIHVDGKLVPFIELGVGFNPELTGRENVYLNGAMLGFTESEMDAQYDKIVAFAELEEFMDQKLKNYSSGMQVRLAFSVATTAKADILLIDEVLAVGDADFQRKCFDYFKKLKGGETTVVFVTHDMNAVREYCDRAMLIEKSEVVSIGNASDIATRYSKLFVGTSNNNDGVDEDEEQKRWGDKKVLIENLKAPKKITESKPLKFDFNIACEDEVDSLAVGFFVRNNAGLMVAGTNSQLEGITIKQMKAGIKKKISIEVPNIFSNGLHTVTLAIVHRGGVSTADWWEEAFSFEVRKSNITPYITAPNIDIEVKNV